ncbi:MAG: nucleotide exchange factor GrpE, partial [Moraxellaceae bacterium]|nr:nucleotide exchange factor GrpE [Moraxellaceae bacterium]
MSEPQTPETDAIDAQTEQEFLEVTETQVEVLSARIAELEAQLKDTQLRAQAEIRNIQSRAEREVSNAHKYGVEKFANVYFRKLSHEQIERYLHAEQFLAKYVSLDL